MKLESISEYHMFDFKSLSLPPFCTDSSSTFSGFAKASDLIQVDRIYQSEDDAEELPLL